MAKNRKQQQQQQKVVTKLKNKKFQIHVLLHLICTNFLVNTSSFNIWCSAYMAKLQCTQPHSGAHDMQYKSKYFMPWYCLLNLSKGIEPTRCNFPIWILISKREPKFKLNFMVFFPKTKNNKKKSSKHDFITK